MNLYISFFSPTMKITIFSIFYFFVSSPTLIEIIGSTWYITTVDSQLQQQQSVSNTYVLYVTKSYFFLFLLQGGATVLYFQLLQSQAGRMNSSSSTLQLKARLKSNGKPTNHHHRIVQYNSSTNIQYNNYNKIQLLLL